MTNSLRSVGSIAGEGAKRASIRLLPVLVMTIAVIFTAGAPAYASGLTINATFDSSITGNANAAQIESGINTAIGIYESLYSDPITVTILFRYASTEVNGVTPLPGGTLARSNYVYYAESSNTFITALKADSKTANDATAIANLQSVLGTTNIDPSAANGRAVGLNTPGVMQANGTVGGGTFDGIVTLNSSQPIQFSRSGGILATNFDGQRLVEHEIDEVLGLGSILPNTADYTGITALRPQDLFRYSAPGAPSLTSNNAATSYLSIDGGVTSIVGFNQDPGGDYGDWLSPNCPQSPNLVQYAFSCPGGTADISAISPEGINLDVIGYDATQSTSVPEPGSLLLLGTGLATVLASMHRKLRS